MLRSAKLYEGRNVVRFVLIALSGLWLSGCSTDATRLTEAMNQPFSNPFSGTPSAAAGKVPTPAVTSAPVAAAALPAPNFAYQAPAHPSPVVSTAVAAPTTAPLSTGAIRPPSSAAVSGGAGGWTAVGGSPVLVLQGDTADSLARRYGVPVQALLGANGLKSASQVHSGMHMIVPVYNAHAVSSTSPSPIPAAAEPVRKTAASAESEEPVKTAPKKGRALAADDSNSEDRAKPKSKSKTVDTEEDLPSKAKGKKHAVEEADATPAKGKKAKADAAETQDGAPKAKGKKHAVEEADATPAKGKAAKAEEADATPAKGKKSKADDAASGNDLPTKGKGKKQPVEVADAPPAKGKKVVTETAEAAPAKAKGAAKVADSKVPEPKVPETKGAKPSAGATTVAKADPKVTKPDPKSVSVDTTPTSRVAPSTASEPVKTAADADAAGANPEFRWPARGRIIQGFKSGGNDGINISVPEGTSVRAAENGVVAYAGSELKGYGNLVLIRHPNGFVTAYANNGEIDVKRGDQVKRGQVIAKSGESGNVSTPQLHFELRDKAGQPVDPTNFLAGI